MHYSVFDRLPEGDCCSWDSLLAGLFLPEVLPISGRDGSRRGKHLDVPLQQFQTLPSQAQPDVPNTLLKLTLQLKPLQKQADSRASQHEPLLPQTLHFLLDVDFFRPYDWQDSGGTGKIDCLLAMSLVHLRGGASHGKLKL